MAVASFLYLQNLRRPGSVLRNAARRFPCGKPIGVRNFKYTNIRNPVTNPLKSARPRSWALLYGRRSLIRLPVYFIQLRQLDGKMRLQVLIEGAGGLGEGGGVAEGLQIDVVAHDE